MKPLSPRSVFQFLLSGRLWFIVAIFLPIAIWAQEPDRQEAIREAEEELSELRGELALQQRIWPQNLAIYAVEGIHETILGQLVNQPYHTLREGLLTLIEHGTSSPALLAIQQAHVDVYLEEIRVLENALGTRTGEKTTQWNVLTDEEIDLALRRTTEGLKSIAIEHSRYPEVFELELRRLLLEKWQASLQTELSRRQQRGTICLKNIDPVQTEAQVKRGLAALNSWQADHRPAFFQKKLLFQTLLLNDQLPNDPSLNYLKNNAPDIDPFRLSGQNALQQLQQRGPPSKWTRPVEEMRQMLDLAIVEELQALRLGDTRQLAEARASIRMTQDWLRVALADTDRPGLRFDYVGDQSLLNLYQEYKNFYKEQVKTPGNSPYLGEAKALMEETQKALFNRFNTFSPPKDGPPSAPTRGPPPARPPDPGFSQALDPVLSNPERASSVKNFEADFDSRIISRVAIENQKIIDKRLSLLPDRRLVEQQEQYKTMLSNRKGQSAVEQLGAWVSFQEQNLKSTAPDGGLAQVKGLAEPAQTRNNLQIAAQPQNKFKGELVKAPIQQQAEFIPENPYPKDFNHTFPDNPKNRNHRLLIQRIEDAPGGVILDISLPDTFLEQIEAAQVDLATYTLFLKVSGQWYPVNLPHDPLLLRQALAFARDGRVVATDLRGLGIQEMKYWLRPGINSKENELKRMQRLNEITTVNLHPALEDTPWGLQFILADQVMFDFLPSQTFTIEVSREKSPFDLKKLYKYYLQDRLEERLNGQSNRHAISKSILSVTSLTVTLDTAVQLSTKIDFELFLKDNEEYRKMENTSNWFGQNADALRESISSLESVSVFAAAVAVFRSCRTHKVENNFDELLFVVVPQTNTPDLLYEGKMLLPELVQFLKGQR